MPRKLELLTYVYDGDPGALGELLRENHRVLRFHAEGSGLIGIATLARAATGNKEVKVRVEMIDRSALPPELIHVVGGQVPCIVGHSAGEPRVIVARAAIERFSGTLSDVRGKVRYGLARVGWELE